jgi:hypothetical protein
LERRRLTRAAKRQQERYVKLNYHEDLSHLEAPVYDGILNDDESYMSFETTGPQRQYNGIRDVIRAARKEIGALISADEEFPVLTPTPPISPIQSPNGRSQSFHIRSPRASKAIVRKTIPGSNDFASYKLNCFQESKVKLMKGNAVHNLNQSIAGEVFSVGIEASNLLDTRIESNITKEEYSLQDHNLYDKNVASYSKNNLIEDSKISEAIALENMLRLDLLPVKLIEAVQLKDELIASKPTLVVESLAICKLEPEVGREVIS